MPKLEFRPSAHGFHFPNAFTNHVGPFTTDGRCGGMVAATLDYYLSGLAVPTHKAVDFPSGSVPQDGSILGDYIYARLMDSILNTSASRFIGFPWQSDQQWFEWTVNEAFPLLRERIDAGQLVPLGLQSKTAGAPGRGHQVLAYGYELNPPAVYIYDNVHPDHECVLRPIDAVTGVREYLAEQQDGGGIGDWRCFFVHDWYDFEHPQRPPYLDLGIADGVQISSPSLSATSPVVSMVAGDKLELTATVRNFGSWPARLNQLFVWVRGPAGGNPHANLDHLLGGGDQDSMPVQPGEERVIHRTADHFGQEVGRYTVGISYLSEQGHWLGLAPVIPGTRSQVQVDLRASAAQSLVVSSDIEVPESSSLVDTGIDIPPGGDFELLASGTIWSGAWFFGRNGPGGFTWVDHDPKFPLHEGPGAHPFCLIGRLGNDGWFFVGDHLPRQHQPGPGPRRLFLRTNDDTPNNGNGSFSCHVNVWH